MNPYEIIICWYILITLHDILIMNLDLLSTTVRWWWITMAFFLGGTELRRS